jgi:hypothetical protein
MNDGAAPVVSAIRRNARRPRDVASAANHG